MPTPIQPPVTVETPYGTARMTDARHYKDNDLERGRNADLAYFYFDEVTVNRKTYTGARFALRRPHYDTLNPRVITDNYYAGLTDSARTKVTEALEAQTDLFAPYLDELDEASVRLQIKSEIGGKVRAGLRDAAPNHYHKGPDFQLREDIIGEILAEMIAAHDTGLSWSEVYYNDKKK